MIKRTFFKKLWLIVMTIITSLSTANAHPITRNIYIAGIVVDAQNLAPVPSAQLFDSEDHLLGSSDEKGYFKIQIDYEQSGPIKFSFKVIKEGFDAFIQRENWADIFGNSKRIMYFGLRQHHSNYPSFSSLGMGANGDLSYSNVLENFARVKAKKEFEDKLAKAKLGNDNVFIVIDNKPYIVNNTGWIQINSDKDKILLNNKKTVEAIQLNSVIKRKNVKGMTPVDSKDVKFSIFTYE